MTDTPTHPEATCVYLGRHISWKSWPDSYKVYHAYAPYPRSEKHAHPEDRLLYSRPLGAGKRGSDTVGGLYTGR